MRRRQSHCIPLHSRHRVESRIVQNKKTQPIVITAGEPAGVGADLCLELLADSSYSHPLVVVGDAEVLTARARLLNLPHAYPAYDGEDGKPNAPRAILNLPLPKNSGDVVLGKPSAKHAAHVLAQLTRAARGCLAGEFAGLLTAPVCKESILAAGHAFTGQTEFLAAQCTGSGNDSTPAVVMLLSSPKLHVALATTHIRLHDVAAAIRQQSLLQTITVLHNTLPLHFGGKAAAIKVCGLNPHAGEGGYLGDEEATAIAPAIQEARRCGIDASGPYPADTLLHAACEEQAADANRAVCVLAMYHDQALPAIKLLDFYETINITLGLPFVRTSPDHGVAADRAGCGTVRSDSMHAALRQIIRSID